MGPCECVPTLAATGPRWRSANKDWGTPTLDTASFETNNEGNSFPPSCKKSSELTASCRGNQGMLVEMAGGFFV